MHRTRLLAATAIALVVACSLQSASTASAPSPNSLKAGAVRPAKVVSGHHATGKLPAVTPAAGIKGYSVVSSATFSDPANSQVSGSVSCPAGNKVIGGGAVISGSSTSENVNTSAPSSSSAWQVYINNSSATAGTFVVYAECAKKVAKYAIIVGTSVSNTAGSQNSASVACPAKKVPFGGGGVGSSSSPLQNLNTSIPSGNGWRVDVNNGSTSASSATAYVICGVKPTGYSVVSGTAVTVPATSQSGPAVVACPTGTVVLSGGAFSSSGSTLVNLNSTFPSGSTGWRSYENNATSGTSTVASYAVCATMAGT